MRKFKGGEIPDFTETDFTETVGQPHDRSIGLEEHYQWQGVEPGQSWQQSFQPVIDPVDTRPKAPNSRIPTLDLLDPIVPPQSNGTCPGGYVLQDGECKLRMPSSLILRQLKHYNQIAPTLLDEYNRNRGSFASSDDRKFFEKLVKAFESSTGFTLNSYRQLQSYTSPYEDFRGIRRPTDELIQDLVANFAEFKRQTGIPFVYARQIDKLLDRRTGPDADTLGRITGPSDYNVSGGRRKHKTRKSSRRHRR